MIVTHNRGALGALRHLNKTQGSLAGTLSRLASGLRINTGQDAPADLIISEQFRAQTAGLQQAVANTQAASHVMGIAEGALDEVNAILNTMEQLALHAANHGVTSPEQIAADQAEVDSSIQTIDRIAQTTKYSDQFLLNGSQELSFSPRTRIETTADFPLLDTTLSRIDQVRAMDHRLAIGFMGDDGSGDAAMIRQARKAYLELDGDDSELDVTTNSEGLQVLSLEQTFTLQGEEGTREFTFPTGTSLGEMRETLARESDAMGIEATLIFGSSQEPDIVGYTVTPINTILGVQTDGNAGTIPTFGVGVAGIQGMPGAIAINALDQVNNFEVIATAVGGDQVTFTLTDDVGNTLDTQTYNLAVVGGGGAGTQAVTLASGNGSGLSFTYNYGNDGAAAYDRPVGNLLDFDIAGAITNNGVNTVGTYTGGVPQASLSGLPAAAAVGANDMIGGSWTVTTSTVDADTVRFTLRDNTNQRVVNSNVDMPLLGDIGTGTVAVNLATGNGTTVNFNYGYENDPNAPAWDRIGNGIMVNFNRTGNQTFVNVATTNGPAGAVVTSPTAPVAAVQNLISQVDIFDVVNAETPLTVSAAAGAAVDEVIFTVSGATTDPLVTQTVNLAPFASALTGSQAIILTTPNGSTLNFDYVYENDPAGNRYDRPVGNLFTVDANPVASERLFDSLTAAAIAAGASVDVNLDPSTGTHLQNLEYGRNTDGEGRMFIKIVEHDTATQRLHFELYKNREYSPSALVGVGRGVADGVNAITIQAANNSNLAGEITFDDAGGTVDFSDSSLFGEKAYIAIGGIAGINGVDYEGAFESALNAGAGQYNYEQTVFSGVSLGENTDRDGRIYFKTVQDGANTGQVFAYADSAMGSESLVAQSRTGTSLLADTEVVLDAVDESGLGILLRTGAVDWGGANGVTIEGASQFTNLGVRITAEEYGSGHGFSITQEEGTCWKSYPDPASATGEVVPDNGEAQQFVGADAVVSVNGVESTCDGLTLELSTVDVSGTLVFNEGEVGATTVAQVGYTSGSVFANATFLTDTADGWTDANADGVRNTNEIDTFKGGANLVNVGRNTVEVIDGFTGGMNLHIGGDGHDKDGLAVGLASMAASQLGLIRSDDGSLLSLESLLSGGEASLMEDPVMALNILTQARDDVSLARARIGAWQSNLLQTNSNSLNVAIERVTATESFIRDANMAHETTAFTRDQLLAQVGTQMLAQANASQQIVLQLLNG
ncbi:MAG: flagellin N-terminal helical domain-containing protein [Planctomycetota bacterium]|jgi:flagellin-like hook-associated protein FlgL